MIRRAAAITTGVLAGAGILVGLEAINAIDYPWDQNRQTVNVEWGFRTFPQEDQ